MVEFVEAEKGTGALAFADVVGQEDLKEALLAVAANDALDGLLVQGEKGTAKSTTVRALADLLPTQRAVADCPYGCDPDDAGSQCADCRERENPPVTERPVPLVTLPLGATRERVVGTLSVADALDGDYEFEPGLLARANRGILYVDEVNLLDDHLVDVLLDAAASGVNRVERDAVSVTHPAEFTLVGTMNPEEGDLRPQLRDRFALQATVTGCADIDDRVTIVDRALNGSESSSDGETSNRETAPADRLAAARDTLDAVELPRNRVEQIAELCRDAGIDGHRGDIATARAARTLAALDDREQVTADDVQRAAELALPHRLRARPFEDAADVDDLVDEHFGDGREDSSETGSADGEAGDGEDAGESAGPDAEDSSDGADPEESTDESTPEPNPGAGDERDTGAADEDGGQDADRDGRLSSEAPGVTADGGDGNRDAGDDATDNVDSEAPSTRDGGDESDGGDDGEAATPVLPGQSAAVGAAEDCRAPDLRVPDGTDDGDVGSRGSARTEPSVGGSGPRVRTRAAESTGGVDAAASVRAAASRGASAPESRDLRASVRADEAASLVVFVVDASASMRPAMRAAKGTVLELLEEAYLHRDQVAFVAFAGDDAEVLLPPTDSVTLAARHLKDLPTDDRTPLPAGLRTAAEVLDRADPAASVVVLVTDGKANVADGSPVEATRLAARDLAACDPELLVVDTGEGDRAGLVDCVLSETGGDLVTLDSLTADRVDRSVASARDR